MDPEETLQNKNNSKPTNANSLNMTLQKAVDMGEYDPDYLSQFEEWQNLTPHLQGEMIRQAIKNRKKQLMIKWAEVNNVLDFRLKPELKQALRKLETEMKKVDSDEEHLMLEYF